MHDIVAIDTETTGLQVWHGDSPFAIGACWPDGTQEYWSWPVDPFTRTVLYEADPTAWHQANLIISNPKIAKVFHNAKFDVRMLERGPGIKVRGKIHETTFAAHACNTLEPTFKLKPLARKYCGIAEDDEKDLQRAVVAGRRTAKKMGWWIAQGKDATKQDYWIPLEIQRHALGKGFAKYMALHPEADFCRTYCMRDTERTMLLWLMYNQVMDDLDVRGTYEQELALWPVTYTMEARGVMCRLPVTRKELRRYSKIRAEQLSIVYELAGEEFDIESKPALARILYGKLGLPVLKYTEKSGDPCTAFSAIEEHKQHPFVRALLQYRAADKACKSFFQKYIENIVPDPLNPGAYALHADFQQVGPVTGRFSCRNPNLQNVANALTTRSDEPIQARTPFGPRPGYTWYHFDYEQLEVRIFADVSQEQTMLAAIASERDLHTECANKAWGGAGNPVAIDSAIHSLELHRAEYQTPACEEFWRRAQTEDRAKVAIEWLASFNWDIVAAEASLGKKTARARAKMVLFAKLFGGGAHAIMDLTKTSEAEARQFMADYDRAFPDIVRYIRGLSYQAREDGYIRNKFGRLTRVDPDKAYRAVNYMVQGSAADFMKKAMRRVDGMLRISGLDAHLVLTIHDELVVEIRKDHAFKWLLRDIKGIMEDHGGAFGITMPVDCDRVTVHWDKKAKVRL